MFRGIFFVFCQVFVEFCGIFLNVVGGWILNLMNPRVRPIDAVPQMRHVGDCVGLVKRQKTYQREFGDGDGRELREAVLAGISENTPDENISEGR